MWKEGWVTIGFCFKHVDFTPISISSIILLQ